MLLRIPWRRPPRRRHRWSQLSRPHRWLPLFQHRPLEAPCAEVCRECRERSPGPRPELPSRLQVRSKVLHCRHQPRPPRTRKPSHRSEQSRPRPQPLLSRHRPIRSLKPLRQGICAAGCPGSPGASHGHRHRPPRPTRLQRLPSLRALRPYNLQPQPSRNPRRRPRRPNLLLPRHRRLRRSPKHPNPRQSRRSPLWWRPRLPSPLRSSRLRHHSRASHSPRQLPQQGLPRLPRRHPRSPNRSATAR